LNAKRSTGPQVEFLYRENAESAQRLSAFFLTKVEREAINRSTNAWNRGPFGEVNVGSDVDGPL
jgi:hypothetical protein